MARILLAKTALDGHWRGTTTVARALRDDGHEVLVLGMARDDEIAGAAVDEDVDLVGLNIGGRIEVVERILDALAEVAPDLPVFAGGTVAPWAVARLEERGVQVFPPGSSLGDIAAAARTLTDVDPSAPTPGPARPGTGRAVDGRAGRGRSDDLLDAAARLFDEFGYGQVGMRAIAEAAGATTGALYHHFSGKAEILERICLTMTETFVDEHLPLLEGDDPPPDRLRELTRRHVVYFWDRRVWLSVAFRELRSLPPEQLATVTAHRRRYQHAIRAVVAAGRDSGELVVADPALATMALLDSLNGINRWFRPDGSLDITDVADAYADLVVDQLLGASLARSRRDTHRDT